jgi:hypothetical protein
LLRLESNVNLTARKNKRRIAMEKSEKQAFPRWLFAVIAIGGLLASGIYMGIMSVEGFTNMRLVQTVGYGLLGLVMFWGAIQTR